MPLLNSTVKILVTDFYRQHNLKDCNLKFKVAQTQTEVLGPMGDPQKIGHFKGGFYPSENIVLLISNNHNSSQDLLDTLQHEICGHFFINFLSVTQKNNLLKSIEKEFKSVDCDYGNIIDRVEKNKYYATVSSLHKAEEVFSFIAQDIKIDHNISYKPFASMRANTMEKIENIIQNIAAGIRENRLKQQIFPKNNNDLGITPSLKR